MAKITSKKLNHKLPVKDSQTRLTTTPLSLILILTVAVLLWLACSATRSRTYGDPARDEIARREEQKALARGKAIWMDPNIGANGRSCESCHENGFLTNAEQYPRYKHILRTMATLSLTHNFAVVKESKGKPWEIGSYDANALTLYVTALANGKKMRIAEPVTYSKVWIERGRAAFGDPQLGSNHLSCSSCHQKNKRQPLSKPAEMAPNLKGVAAVFPRYSFEQNKVITLEQQINHCLEQKMEGSPLPLDNERIVALCCYLAYLSKGKKISVAQLEHN